MIAKHLLNEKFVATKLPHVCLHRKELLKKFEHAAENRLVFISAPAGYGKTVSTQLWLSGSEREYIWITLDGYDNSPSIFYKLFCKGIYALQPDNKEMEKIILSSSFASSPVEHTIRLLAEFVPDDKKYALILDDTHLITNKELWKSGLLVKKRLPLSFVTLILTRNEVADYTNDMENERYAVISSKELALSANEIQSFFSIHGHSITADEAEKVFTVTDGWAIGINALALSGQTEPGLNGLSILGNYIKNNMWDKWDSDLREFMLKTSQTDEMPVRLCEKLTGHMESREVLERLCQTNSFVSRLSEDVYEYHNLFLEFLRGQAEEYGIDTKRLYKIAAEYYMEQGDYFLARRYARKSGNTDLIKESLHYLYQFGIASIDEFVIFSKMYEDEAPPESSYEREPFLYSMPMWENYLRGNAAKMEYYLDKLYENLPVIAERYPQEYEAVVMQLSLDHRISLSELFKGFSSLPPFLYYHNNLQGSTLTQEMPFIHRSDRDYSELADESLINKFEETYGQLFKDDCDLILKAHKTGIYLEKNMAEEALKTALEAKELIKENTRAELSFCVLANLTATYYAVGSSNCLDMVEEINNFIKKKETYYLNQNFMALKTKIQLLNGNGKAARDWLNNYFVTDTDSLELHRIYQYFATAKSYLTLGQTDKAMDYITKLKQLGKDFNRPLDIAEAGVLQSIIEWALGLKKEAQLTLEIVLRDMQPFGFIRVIAIEGAAVLPILKRIISKIRKEEYDGDLQIEYVQKVLIAAYAQASTHKGVAANIKGGGVKLTKQQKLILTLLTQGCSYLEAADKAGISIHTVKSHALAVYEKLGVHSQFDAAIKAKELRIIN